MCVDRKNRNGHNFSMEDNNKIVCKMLSAVVEQLEQIKNLIENKETPEAASARALAERGLCTYCQETIGPDEIKIRGCHQRCHRKINRAIHSSVVTDQQAVARGWLLPAEKGGRKFAEDEPLGKLTASRTPKRKK